MPKLSSKQFNEIAAKARLLLKKRTKKDILFALEIISRNYPKWEQSYCEAMQIEANEDDVLFFLTPTLVLKRQIGHFDISGQKSFKKAQWEDYFSILALALIGNAINHEKITYPNYGFIPDDIEKDKLNTMEQFLTEAGEALDFAETIIYRKRLYSPNAQSNPEDLFVKEEKKANSAWARKMAKERHDPKMKIKLRFVQFYVEKRFHVFSFSVKEFYKLLSKDEINELCGPKGKESEKDYIDSLVRTFRRFIKNFFPNLINPKNSRLRPLDSLNQLPS